MIEGEKEIQPTSQAVPRAIAQKREAEWERQIEESSEEIVNRVCEPLPHLPSRKKRYKFLDLTREYYQELIRFYIYSAGLRFPGEERDRAIQALDAADFD